MQGTMGKLRSGLRLMKVGRKRATELVKARKMTKDGRNEHTSDYLSVYWIEEWEKFRMGVRRAWM